MCGITGPGSTLWTCGNLGRGPRWGRVARMGAFGRRTTTMKSLVIGLDAPGGGVLAVAAPTGCSGGTYRPRLHRVLAATSRRAEVAAEPDRRVRTILALVWEQLLASTRG